MEQRNNLVLHGTETFSRGALDNVALESGAVVLDSSMIGQWWMVRPTKISRST